MNSRPLNPTAGAHHRSWFSWRTWAAGIVLAGGAGLGCQGEAPQSQQKDPDVEVSTLFSGKVNDSEVFTGRTQTMHYVDIKARVTGYLKKIYFKEGEDVQEGAPLFDIDSTPYDAARDQAQATANQADAQAKQALTHLQSVQDTYKRDLASPSATPEAIAIQDRDAVDEAQAALNAARETHKAALAALKTAQTNVDYCHIKAEYSGRISRLSVDLNNDVIADSTVLASLVQLQPKMYAYFDVDERTMLDLVVSKQDKYKPGFLPQGKVSDEAVKNLHLMLSLANDDENPETFDHPGGLAIVDNKIDAATGTVRMWGTFDNDRKDLEPGLFVRVRMDKGAPHEALLVSEAALGSDQGFQYLYTVNDKNEAEYTRVDVGSKTRGRIAVTAAKGYPALTKDTRVVVDGLQRIHPVLDEKTGKPKPVKINATVVDMPQAEEEGSGVRGQGSEKKPAD